MEDVIWLPNRHKHFPEQARRRVRTLIYLWKGQTDHLLRLIQLGTYHRSTWNTFHETRLLEHIRQGSLPGVAVAIGADHWTEIDYSTFAILDSPEVRFTFLSILDRGIDDMYPSNCPLTAAAWYGQFEIVRFLVEQRRWTRDTVAPIAFAAFRDHVEIVSYLVEKGYPVGECARDLARGRVDQFFSGLDNGHRV